MTKRIFAIGDIHGCFDGLRTLVEEKISLEKEDKLILLGDYIDRGFQSKDVLDYIMRLRHDGFDIVPLLVNHEQLLIDAYENPRNLSNWTFNGGDTTFESFNIESLQDIDPGYIEFLKSLQYYYLFDNYIFVHAGFNDDIEDPFKDDWVMIWRCSDEYMNPVLKDRIIIHGHCPVTLESCRERVKTNQKVIDIDTGYVFSHIMGYGNLTAIEVNTMKLFSHND